MTQALNTFTSLSEKKNTSHKELSPGRIKRDTEDFGNIKAWFSSHNPFAVVDHLVGLDSGLIDVDFNVTCDKAETIGASIHEEMAGKTYTEVSFKRSRQITNLQSLSSSVKIDNENVSIDPMTLFLRLAFIIEKKPEKEIEEYFYYELTPFPLSLFKDGVMRPSQKHKLKSFLTKPATSISHIPDSLKVIDGGALLWVNDWKKGERFEDIFKKYVSYLQHLQSDVVVFDGYEVSTKDTTRMKRGLNTQAVEIHEKNPCPCDRSTFFSNYTNKKSFIEVLATKLRGSSMSVHMCPADADTTIVKEAVQLSKKAPVTVYADDTDILCLLVHHFPTAENPIYLANMKRKGNANRECFNIEDIVKNSNTIKHILFAHAFTGCDTTSAIYNFGKTSIIMKLQGDRQLTEIASVFYENQKSPQEVGNASIQIFEKLNFSGNATSLQQIRKNKYESLVISDRARIDPSSLPPSPRAAYFHGLRVYHQMRVWLSLSNHDIDPCNWGWKLKDGCYTPIPTDENAGPDDLLKVVRCGCKGTCENRCSCRKMGLKCSSTCTNCRGISCNNTEEDVDDDENLNDLETDDRNFLDAFL